jgi:hypothetical protein
MILSMSSVMGSLRFLPPGVASCWAIYDGFDPEVAFKWVAEAVQQV